MKFKEVFFIFIILAIAQLSSCYSVTNETENIEKIIDIDFNEIKKEKLLSEIFSDVYLVKLETTPNSLLGEINKINITGKSIFVSDGLSVYHFDINGKFLNRIHKKGKGPGEYTGISDFNVVENNCIEILNSGQQKVVRFDSSYNFIDEYKVSRYAMNMATHKNSSRLFHCGNDASGNNFDKVLQFQNKKLTAKHLKIDEIRSQYLHYRRFDYFSYYKDGILVTDAHHDTVYFFDQNILRPKYVIDIGEKAVPRPIYQKSYNNVADFSINHLLGTGYLYGVFNFLETEDYLFFHYDERIKSDESMYGKLRPTFVHYNKKSSNFDTFYSIVDDINFIGKAGLNEFTVFYSQTNGLVAYAMQAFNFIEMYQSAQVENVTIKDSTRTLATESIYRNTKPTDNLIVAIGKLK